VHGDVPQIISFENAECQTECRLVFWNDICRSQKTAQLLLHPDINTLRGDRLRADRLLQGGVYSGDDEDGNNDCQYRLS
jgi:hypothetical protein